MCNLDIPVEESAAGLLEKRDTSLTMPWFVPRAKYPPRRGNVIHPLINGERTFIAVDEALSGAKQTIDVISWGFDPSMRLRMPAGKRVGELLREKARAGVAVRVLIWRNVIADAAENNLPGIGLLGSGGGGAGVGSGVGSTSPRDTKGSKGEGFNEYGSGKGSGSGGVQDGDGEAIAFNRAWFKSPGPGISFRTREFSQIDRIQLGYQHARRHGLIAGAGMQRAAFTAFASHHQKTILVDYETPDDAIGFVMGHNLLRNYWDTDAHEYYNPNRLFFRPWQDLSSRVFGPLLYDLNENFCSAWKSAQPLIGSDQPIPASRLALRDEAFVAPAAKKGGQVMAQITRTHPREGDKSICQSYKLALANARNYVYFENQYFRFTPMAMHLREMRRKLKGAGWKRDLYVFVVTNKPDDHGRMNTFDMLRALGKGSAMPKIERKQQGDESPQARELRKADLQGINVVVCTLCSDTTHVPEPQAIETGRLDDMGFPEYRISEPAARQLYADIYVHSKLLLVDDVFFTLGSANVNERSMENDTELNVAATAPELTREWREKLWTLHTRRGPFGDMGREFEVWTELAKAGLQNRLNGAPLTAPLIEFFDDSDSGRSTD